MLCPKKIGLTSGLTLSAGYSLVLAHFDWDQAKIDLTAKKLSFIRGPYKHAPL